MTGFGRKGFDGFGDADFDSLVRAGQDRIVDEMKQTQELISSRVAAAAAAEATRQQEGQKVLLIAGNVAMKAASRIPPSLTLYRGADVHRADMPWRYRKSVVMEYTPAGQPIWAWKLTDYEPEALPYESELSGTISYPRRNGLALCWGGPSGGLCHYSRPWQDRTRADRGRRQLDQTFPSDSVIFEGAFGLPDMRGDRRPEAVRKLLYDFVMLYQPRQR